MRKFVARMVLDEHQPVTLKIIRCAEIAGQEGEEKEKEELLDIAEKCLEVEKLLLIHLPKEQLKKNGC